jgi:hypothetical protein
MNGKCGIRHNGVLFSHKNNDILSVAETCMELGDIILSEIHQAHVVTCNGS